MEKRVRRIKNINTFPKPISDYEIFCEKYPDTELGKTTHTAIVNDSLKLIAEMILTDVTGFKLPRSMGYLAITKFKPAKRRKNFKASHEHGKEIPFLNLKTFGYTMYVKWFKPHRNFANKRLYSFDACRYIDRNIKVQIEAGRLYEELDRDFYYALVRECTPEYKLDQQRTKLRQKLESQAQSRERYQQKLQQQCQPQSP